jgi:hypothetical protein
MHSSPSTATTPHTASPEEMREPSQRAGNAYKGLTIAAMLFLLGSLILMW